MKNYFMKVILAQCIAGSVPALEVLSSSPLMGALTEARCLSIRDSAEDILALKHWVIWPPRSMSAM